MRGPGTSRYHGPERKLGVGCFRPFPLVKTSASHQPLQIVSIKGLGPLAAADHPLEGGALGIVTSRGAGGVQTGGLPALTSPPLCPCRRPWSPA